MTKIKTTEEKLKDGEIEMIKDDPIIENLQQKKSEEITKPSIESYIATLQQLRGLKKTLVSAPTFIPKNFYESIQFYDTGGVRRLYLYVNKVWRYVVLT